MPGNYYEKREKYKSAHDKRWLIGIQPVKFLFHNGPLL